MGEISHDILKKSLLDLLYNLSFRYSETPTFDLAYKKEKSNYYIEAKNTTLSAEGMILVGNIIYNMIASLEINGIGGLTFGADPIAISTATIANLNGKKVYAFSVRKEPKGHGTQKWIEGNVKSGDNVIIVDDVVTTGRSTLSAVEAARNAGLNIVKVIVLVDRQEEEKGKENIEKEGLEVEALFTKDDLIRLHNERSYKSSPSRIISR